MKVALTTDDTLSPTKRRPYAPCPCGSGQKFRFCNCNRVPHSPFREPHSPFREVSPATAAPQNWRNTAVRNSHPEHRLGASME